MENEKFIGREIRKTDNMLKRIHANSELHKKIQNITGTNGWIIGFLADNSDRDIFQKDIEEIFSLRRSTVSNMVQLMEKKGFIARESVDYDARLKKLVLTQKALEIHKAVLADVAENEKKLKSEISEEELKTFFDVIGKIQKNLETLTS
ncbi:MAG: MarR family winged helix-turn-helix transcriptional regulator [Acutalibacteraceae bacterium]